MGSGADERLRKMVERDIAPESRRWFCLDDIQAELADMERNKQQDEITLASAHWQYIESVLKQHGEEDSVIAKCGHHYKAAFLHGWKHAKEDSL